MTLAAITMTAPEAASPVQMYRATYSPDDNKLRLYAVSRLDPETYKKVHDAGFRWAPEQALFVAPAWTPGREDVLLSLAGEIEDEDSTLAERQEARAERFTGYSGKRASESAQALDEVERLAAMIPPGQPILVGHHSERRARRDAQRIENGMKRAVMLFERAEYWEERARSALLHAKYKERPDVLYTSREAVPTAHVLPSIPHVQRASRHVSCRFQYAAHHDGRGVRCDAPQEWADRAGSSRPVFPLHQVPVRIHWPAFRCIR